MSKTNSVRIDEQGYVELNINGLGFKKVKDKNRGYIKQEKVKMTENTVINNKE